MEKEKLINFIKETKENNKKLKQKFDNYIKTLIKNLELVLKDEKEYRESENKDEDDYNFIMITELENSLPGKLFKHISYLSDENILERIQRYFLNEFYIEDIEDIFIWILENIKSIIIVPNN